MTRGARPAPPACPFCGETRRVAPIAQFGGQIITSQWHCGECNSYYEAIRSEFEPPARLVGERARDATPRPSDALDPPPH